MIKVENGNHKLSNQRMTGLVSTEKIRMKDGELSLKDSHLDPNSLSTFQRILLTTNGTVTDILESYLAEQIQLVKLSENLVSMEHDIPSRQIKKGDQVIEREVLLRGKLSLRNVIYASSVVLVDNLSERFRNELLKTKTPIGKLWFEHKVEKFKELMDSGKEPAQELSQYFVGVEPEDNLLFRTYGVFSQGKPTMIITEKFPESYFLQDF
ncbi:MAG: chorismate pyruvate-lyase family protein [Crocosphaera sp.]